MLVYTFQSSGPALLADSELNTPSSGNRIVWNKTVPSTGYWKVGDKCYSTDKDTPSLAWTCTGEGPAASATWSLDGPVVQIVGNAHVNGMGQAVFIDNVGIFNYLAYMGVGEYKVGSNGFPNFQNAGKYNVYVQPRSQTQGEEFLAYVSAGTNHYNVSIRTPAGTPIDSVFFIMAVSNIASIGPSLIPA